MRLAGKRFRRCNNFPIATRWDMGSSQCTEKCITSLWSVDCWTHTKICYHFQCYNPSVVFHLSFSWNKYIKTTRWCLALWNNFIAPQHFFWWKLAMRSLPALPARGEAGRKRRRTTGYTRCHGNNTFSKLFPGPVMNWIRPHPNYQHHLYANTRGDRAANWWQSCASSHHCNASTDGCVTRPSAKLVWTVFNVRKYCVDSTVSWPTRKAVVSHLPYATWHRWGERGGQ